MTENTEWGTGDSVRAEVLYSLKGYTRLFLDLLMDHPDERIDTDRITAYLTQHRPKGSAAPNKLAIGGSLTPIGKKCRELGRKPPYNRRRSASAASDYVMKPTVARLFREARMKVDPNYPRNVRRAAWSSVDLRAIVADYLEMLTYEVSGRNYSKPAHRRKLRQHLNKDHTDEAIELKYQNISAAVLALGLPYIRGYKPRSNYQAALMVAIQHTLEANLQLLRALRAGFHDGTPPDGPLQLTPPPAPSAPTAASRAVARRKGRHLDYGLLHEENSRRGAQGERLVADYERAWLRQRGRDDLASRVQWTAREIGDGLGYDVLSFDVNGEERYIEVKTTAQGDETPFYLTSAELDFAQRHTDRYSLYRMYDVLRVPRFFCLEGDISKSLTLTPAIYSAQVAAAPSAHP